ncbi:c-type cytochrome [Candidatus Halobeggiatoa sp. HSG11]|nr:c-type cytochrome [Candidatus Halobeggiatoa sp. HSG11]
MNIVTLGFAVLLTSTNGMAQENLQTIQTVSHKGDKTEHNGAKLYVDKGCVACHGKNGNVPTQLQYPKLAGQNKEYIIAQIDDIKNGLRTNGHSIVMRGTIIVDKHEMGIIAEWLESLPVNIIEENFKNTKGAELFKSKSCNICHGDDTQSPSLSVYPKLAGQNKIYSLTQMKDIKSGERNNGNSAAMQGILHDLTEQEMAILAEWLESVTENELSLADK